MVPAGGQVVPAAGSCRRLTAEGSCRKVTGACREGNSCLQGRAAGWQDDVIYTINDVKANIAYLPLSYYFAK